LTGSGIGAGAGFAIGVLETFSTRAAISAPLETLERAV
jgi:hypothetical protein